MPDTLLIHAPAPVIEVPGGLRLDVKFVVGMREHARHWPGPVRCVLRRGAGAIPFGATYRPGELDFELRVLDQDTPLDETCLRDVRAIYAGADDEAALGLASVARARGTALVYSLEYTLETRLQIARLDTTRSLLRRLRSMYWLISQERRRRRALRSADGLQCNGYPALDAYGALNPQPMLYLDNRMTPALMATPGEMAVRAARLRGRAPLRLIHSGRLEPMKGAQDLLAVMGALRALGVDATLDIYGTGSLEGTIRAGLAEFGGAVRLHAPVDFETVLVPASRAEADVFLSCHRQSDPSCTYLEAMGCGLAVAGTDNRMWSRLAAEAGAGIVAPMGDTGALARRIAEWDRDREALITAAAAGLGFARRHDFPTEFTRRMDHLKAIAL